jgi:hypothetical protein
VTPPPGKLFTAVMYAPGADVGQLLGKLSGRYGPVDARSRGFPFDLSDYYLEEMGAGLTKFFVSFSRLFPRERLPGVKVLTNSMELESREQSGRVFNLDPGILTLASVALATTKDFSHRIYMGEGIYQEVTLIYERKSQYQPLPWTYPDYVSPAARDFFREVREIYRQQLESIPAGRGTA